MDIIWSVFLRTGQTAIESSSTLFVGFFIAAVMRRMLGAEGTRKLFGGEGLKGLFRAWVIGSLLPVCSLGVIPVAREMRRAGVPAATVLAFVLAAPQLNPLSFLYGLTLSEPVVIICFVVATMLLAIGGGEVWKRLFETPDDTLTAGDEPTPAPGVKRLISVVVSAARETVGPSMAYIVLGIVFTGMLAGLLPHGSLGMTMRHDDWSSPALMALIGMPAYSGVLPGMMRIGLIFEHGNSVGAAFILFQLGVGFNLGLILWIIMNYGWKGTDPQAMPMRNLRLLLLLLITFGWRAILWLAILVALALAVAYGMESPLYFAHEEATHTHAFDDWTSPFTSGSDANWEMVRAKLLQKVEVLEPVALTGLLVLVVLGSAIASFDRAGRLERWLTIAPRTPDVPKSIWNRGVPGPVLGVITLLGLVVFSVVALFIYYPEREQVFAEIVQVRAEAIVAIRTGNAAEAIRRIQHWDLLTRKLQVGVFIRTGTMTAVASKATEDLRERLEDLRDALLEDDIPKAKELLPVIEEAYRACKSAYPK